MYCYKQYWIHAPLFALVNIKDIHGSNYTLTMFPYAVFTIHNVYSGRIYRKIYGECLVVQDSLASEIQIFEYVDTSNPTCINNSVIYTASTQYNASY
jgi:hypothetical protein